MSSSTQVTPEESATEGKPLGVRTTLTVPAPISRVWEHLVSATGTEALLGSGAALGSKGESWHSTDGPHGVVRSYHPQEQIRVSWHADEDAPMSMVDLQLAPDGDGATRLDLRHDIDTDAHADMQQRWDDALGRFASGVQA